MEHSESIANLATALSQFQAEMPSVHMDATNKFLGNRYASLGAMVDTARPFLAARGLSVSQIVVTYDGQIGVETILMHASGEWISNTAILPPNAEKGKTAAQVAGSTITYLRRYAYAAILGLYADEDNDGNGQQSGHQKQSQPQQPLDKQAKQEAAGNGSKWPPRPWKPETLKAAIAASVANKPVIPVTKDKAKKLAIVWGNITGQKEDERHEAASYLVGAYVESLNDLSEAVVDALTDWLKKNPPLARKEAQALSELIAATTPQQSTLDDAFPREEEVV